MSTDETASKDIDQTDEAVVDRPRGIEIKINLDRVALDRRGGLHILREGRHAHEEYGQ